MPKQTRIAILAVAIFLTIGATGAMATLYHFYGNATGSWGDLHPFTMWDGYLDTENLDFTGDWGNDAQNYINGDIDAYASGKYYVGALGSGGDGRWAYDGTEHGGWNGWFRPVTSPDSADGYWYEDEHPETFNGVFYGDLYGD